MPVSPTLTWSLRRRITGRLRVWWLMAGAGVTPSSLICSLLTPWRQATHCRALATLSHWSQAVSCRSCCLAATPSVSTPADHRQCHPGPEWLANPECRHYLKWSLAPWHRINISSTVSSRPRSGLSVSQLAANCSQTSSIILHTNKSITEDVGGRRAPWLQYQYQLKLSPSPGYSHN